MIPSRGTRATSFTVFDFPISEGYRIPDHRLRIQATVIRSTITTIYEAIIMSRYSISRASSHVLFPSHLRRFSKMASSVDAKLLKRTKFPPEFNRKVDMTKVNIEVMKK